MLRALRGLFPLMSTSNYHCKHALKVLDLIGVVATTFICITYIVPEVLAGELDPSSQVITVPPSQWTVFLSGLDQYYAALGIPNIFLSNYVIPVPNVTSGPITGMHLQMDSFGLPVLSGSGLSFTLPGITRTNSPGYYMSFAFSSQDNIPATAYSITFTASPWQNLFCTMSDGFTSQVVAINSETTTFTSSRVIGRDAAFGCDNAYGNGTPVYVNINSVSIIQYGFDLSVSVPKISQLGASVGADGITTVSPGSPVTVLVPVTGSNVPSGDSRSTIVKLETANQTFQQTVPLNAIQVAGTLNVPFSVTFGPQDVGLQTITATVDPGNALGESDPSNNIKSVQVKVVAPYKITATVNGSQGSEFSLPPTQLLDPGCSAELLPYVPQSLPVSLQCVDANTNPPTSISGCHFSLQLALGSNNGGHAHGGSDRPLACLPSGSLGCPSITNLITQGQTGLIDQAGTTLAYGAPEISGDVVLTVTGTDPNGNVIASRNLPAPITFHVQANGSPNWVPLSNDDVSVIINGADPNPSHSTGYYGTIDMAKAVTQLGKSFNSALASVETPPWIYSQAASLPWGGAYDIEKDWDTPHCGHRDGMTIDLSLGNLDANEKLKLAKAAQKSGLAFYYIPESPDNSKANHWHATLEGDSQ